MFNDVNPIFSPLLRHAQSSDTRQDIKRHDPEQERRRKKDGQRPLTQGEESAELSIEALIAFLDNITQKPAHDFSHVASDGAGEELQTPDTPPAPPSAGAQNSQAIYARRAYGHAAETAPRAQTLPRTQQPTQHNPSGPRLSQHDAALAAVMLKNLKTLRQRGVTQITFHKNGDFMQSLQSAIQELLSAH